MSKKITLLKALLDTRRIPSCDNPLSRELLGDPFMPDRKSIKKIALTNSAEEKIQTETAKNFRSKEIF